MGLDGQWFLPGSRLVMGALFSFFPALLPAQTGKVHSDLSFPSKILKGERKFTIYLPADYETSTLSYPVLYLLHGYGDNQNTWVKTGDMQRIADQAFATGAAAPMLIVTPDANTGLPGYSNDIKGGWRYEDFFIEEFIPYIEKTYRVKTGKRFRAVAGYSMGGAGAFLYGLHHPEMFAAACPLSAATGPRNLEDARNLLIHVLKASADDLRDSVVEAYFKRENVLCLIENLPDNQKKAVRWYIDCGKDDHLFEDNSLVHLALRKKEIPHEFRVRDGGHNWVYWRSALPEVLRFVSEEFSK